LQESLERDAYCPFSALQTADGTTVRLCVAIGEIDNMGWGNPPLMDAESSVGDAMRDLVRGHTT
jgi:hypothetical protein